MTAVFTRFLFDFEYRSARRNAFLLLLVAAVLSPNISTFGALPAVRLEQLLAIVLLPSLALYMLRHEHASRFGLVDIAFGLLAVATTITLIAAPILVEDVGWSLRDPFEVARIVEYWVLFRIGLTVVADRSLARGTAGVMMGLAVALTAFSVLQYLDGEGSINEHFTSIWTVAHNLVGVERSGRVVGTIGNANYYGIFSVLFLVFALGIVLLRLRAPWPWIAAAYLASFAATLSLVMSQSRTAVLAAFGAMFLGLVFTVFRMGRRAAYGMAVGWFLVSLVISVTFVQVQQPMVGSFADRFAPAELMDDSSLTIRLSKWRSVFSGFFESQPSFCEGERLETLRTASGHEPAATTGQPQADAEALARDEQRRDDVATTTQGVVDYFCEYDKWPHEEPLETALVPEFLAELPTDPATGEVYPYFVHSSGFTIGAELEDPSSPEGPFYTLGTMPNFVLNPSFETGNGGFDRWFTNNGAEVERAGTGLFGDSAARVVLPEGGNFYQTLPVELAQDETYSVGLWVRSPAEAQIEIYMTATLTDGELVEPFAQQTFTVPGGEAWYHVAMEFETPERGRVTVLQILLRNGNGPAEFELDGMEIVRGGVLPSFVTVRDIDPSALAQDLPGFSDSPFIGAGPRKDIELGTVDNEYLLFLDRYGIVGTVAYLLLFFAAFRVAWRAWRPDGSFIALLSLTVMVFTVALAAFNITAGSYYHFQIMAVYWLFVGLLAANRKREGA